MRLANNRSILGAIAMLLAGLVLSSMASSFFDADSGDGLNRSRLWWELVLNSQILCAAFIWFTHIDRLKAADGELFYRRLAQFISAFIAVLLPLWIALLAARLDWFVEKPELSTLHLLIAACLGAWLLASLVPWAIEMMAVRKLVVPPLFRGGSGLSFFLLVWPTLLVIALVVEEQNRGGTLHYVYGPFLLYMQAALPYLRRAIHLGDGEISDDEDGH